MIASQRRALVLAGGGVAGIAWEIGVIQGLADVDPALAAAVRSADLVIGTSAGSAVAAQLTGDVALAELHAAQLDPATVEIDPGVDSVALAERMAPATDADDAADRRRRICAIALATRTVPEAARLQAVRGRLSSLAWPDRDLLLPAVDAATGDRVVFDRTSGVSLLDAVAASCAVPGVWPPVTIGAARYVDGGVWSGTNADLAASAAVVLALVPKPAGMPAFVGAELDDELAELRRTGDPRTFVVYADERSWAAFGADSLSPATRAPAAEAGRAVGRAVAGEVAAVWATG
ncbi:patatin-like phospholipase family protein [Skermania piniformis]|uniref:Patatin-like phospholipase family protein n=1 Tax=Skermania pinensis TaxID=39122 RepID=A0ABX8SC88_9ACTN|nr:patatin-like phospholipase family protein [Skermania piniformis]QXQ15403.1 patatin-like phospholipase family protein [Skermania piniformis]